MTLRQLSGVPHKSDPLENHKAWLWVFPRTVSKPWILYCLSINFSTTECKQMLKEKIKREALLTTELDAFKKELTQNSSDKTSLSE